MLRLFLVQESLKAAGIPPGHTAPAGDFLAAVKQGCGVSPQIACHPGSSDLEEVQRHEMLPASNQNLPTLAFIGAVGTSACACFEHGAHHGC